MCNSTNLPLSDRDSFVEEVREAHHGKLLLYGLGLCQQLKLKVLAVDDLVQDLYVALLVKWPKSEQGYRQKGIGYLFTILKYDARDALRKEKSAKRQEELFTMKFSGSVDLRGMALKGHLQEFYEVLQKYLKPQIYTIMRYYIDGYSYRDISEMQAIPINTVGTKIARAKKKIKTALQE